MMKHYRIAIILLAAVSVLAGCNTPQQKPQNKPEWETPREPPPQTTSNTSSAEDPTGQPMNAKPPASETAENSAATSPPPAAAQAAEAQNQDQNQAPKSESATKPASDGFDKQAAPTAQSVPDVQITEVPLDENGNPIEPEPKAQATSAQQQAGSTGSQMASAGENTSAGVKQSNAGGAVPPSLGTPGNPDPTARGNVVNIGAQTGEEKLAAAHANLDSRLAAFDELMRRAQEAAARARQSRGGGDPQGELDGKGGNLEMPPSERGAGGQADSSSGRGYSPDISGEKTPGDYRHVATGPVPADIPDGKDDDIVARQLREAASRESDPVLREKLWDEYRKYKSGSLGR